MTTNVVAGRALAFPVYPLLKEISGFVAHHGRGPGDRHRVYAETGSKIVPVFSRDQGPFTESLLDRNETGRAASAYAGSREAKRIDRFKTALFVIGILCV